jgi:hypothetical protein
MRTTNNVSIPSRGPGTLGDSGGVSQASPAPRGRCADVSRPMSRPILSRPVGQAVPAETVLDTILESWDNFDSLFRESVPSHECSL